LAGASRSICKLLRRFADLAFRLPDSGKALRAALYAPAGPTKERPSDAHFAERRCYKPQCI